MSDSPPQANPFDEPYPRSSTPRAPPSSRQPPPALVIPATPPRDGERREDAAEHEDHHPNHKGLRVQWPEQVAKHISIPVTSSSPPASPQTLQDRGARDALTAALEDYSRDPTASRQVRYLGSMPEPTSEVSSRGTSVADAADLEEIREGMEVFVDPGETDGLPGTQPTRAKSTKQAWNLVRAYNSGGPGLLKHRRGFRSGHGDGARAEDDDSEKTMAGDDPEKSGEQSGVQRSTSGNSLNRQKSPADSEATKRGRLAGIWETMKQNESPDTSIDLAPTTTPGGGILSALIALQQQQQNGGHGSHSGTPSAATSVASSPSVSRRNSLDDDSDDEHERRKFLKKQQAKRASRQAWFDAPTSAGHAIAGVGRAAYEGAGQAVNFATGGLTSHARSKSSSDLPSLQPTPGSKQGGMMGWMTSNRPTTPTDPPPTSSTVGRKRNPVFDTATQSMKKIGHTFGLDVDMETSRPGAARSDAGVIGGLMLGAGNLAGMAAPGASKLAPQADRPGYHLSRYSAPDVNDKPKPAYASSAPSSRSHSRAGTPVDSRSGTPETMSPPPKSPALDGGKTPSTAGSKKNPFSLALGHLPSTPGGKLGFKSGNISGENSPRRTGEMFNDYFGVKNEKETQEERDRREWEKEKRRRRKAKEKRKQEEVYITMHVAAILERQTFIMKLCRAFLMFGAPSHRLEAQMQATARVLEINAQVVYLPGLLFISFTDQATHTSEVKFLKQSSGLDLGKLLAAYIVYWKVIHDKISVTEASVELDGLMLSPPRYKLWQNLIIGGLASAFIQPSAFYGSLIDCLVAIPLGAFLVLFQVVVSRNDLYSSLFEIVIACINSFIAAALASTGQFCFAAVASGSVVLILPGYIILCGALELANRSLISGSVRTVFAILYSLFLGFGLAIGGEVYSRITGLEIAGGQDYQCKTLRLMAPWWRSTIIPQWYILTIPMFLLMLSLRNGQPLLRKETPVMILIGAAGFSGNYFSGRAFINRADISSAIGSFVVGILGNIYGKFTKASPFVVMVAGVLVQLPSGLANGGLLQFASDNDSTRSYNAGFTAAQSLVEVAIGLTVGLFVSTALANLVMGGGRRRGAHLSSF